MKSLFQQRSKTTLNVCTFAYGDWDRHWEQNDISERKEQEVILIELDQKMYDSLLRETHYLYTLDKAIKTRHEKMCDQLYKQIFKWLVMFSCPGQYAAFNVLFPRCIMQRIEPQRTYDENTTTCIVIANGKEYSVIKHPLTMQASTKYGCGICMDNWVDNLDWLEALIRHTMSNIQKSPTMTISKRQDAIPPTAKIANYFKFKDLITISDEEPNEHHRGKYVLGFQEHEVMPSRRKNRNVQEYKLGLAFVFCGSCCIFVSSIEAEIYSGLVESLLQLTYT